MANPIDNAKNFVNKIKDIFKNIMKIIKFFSTTIGQIIAVIILVIFVVLLFKIIGDIISASFLNFLGINWNYDTYTQDQQTIENFRNGVTQNIEGESTDNNSSNNAEKNGINVSNIIREINDSGYESMINPANYQNFKAFEYAVLMDAAEYLRMNKQEMFDIATNEGDYAFERSLLAQRKPEEYQARIKALSSKYANIGGKTGETTSVKLLETSYTTDQSLVDKDKLEVLSAQVDANANENEILNVGAVKGGNNRVKGPYITYEFKGYNGTGSGKNNTPSTVDVSNAGINNKTPTNTNINSSSSSSSDGDSGSVVGETIEETTIVSGYDTVDVNRIKNKTAKSIYEKYKDTIISSAKEYGIDPYLILAVIMKESYGKTTSYTKPPETMGLMGTPVPKDNQQQYFFVDNVKLVKKKVEYGFGYLNGNATRQIQVGTAYLRLKISGKAWNIYNGVLAYKGINDKGYFGGLMNYYYGEGDPWIISTESKKVFTSKKEPFGTSNKVYADVDTGKEKVTSGSSSSSSGVSDFSAFSSSSSVTSEYFSVDESKLSGQPKKVWDKYSKEITACSRKYGIDPYLIIAVICRESGGDPKCKTSDGKNYAYGLMQIYGSNRSKNLQAEDLEGNKFTLDATDAAMDQFGPIRQIEAGTTLLRSHIKYWNYNSYDGVSAYNKGDAGYKKQQGKDNGYWYGSVNGIKMNFCGGDETWAIKKEAGKYYKVYTNINTKKITRIQEIDPSSFGVLYETNAEAVAEGTTDVNLTGENVTVNDVGTATTADGEPLITGDTVQETSAEKTSGTDTLEPYIYIVKEDIEFSYYIDSNNSVIQYPLLLNANNAKLNVGQENGEEIKRALLGMMPVVWPDESGSYTKTPYYSDVTTPTVYKIPLRTLLGRYLPKQELLLTWSLLKQNIDKETTGTTEKDFMDYVIDSIKGIYNEACLEGEEVKEEIGTRDIINANGEIDTDTQNYSNETTHKKTFVEFAKVGLETTKYDINGLLPLTADDGEKTVKVVTDFVNAIIIKSSFTASYSYTITQNQKVVNDENGNPEFIQTTSTKSGSKTYSLSSLGTFGATKGEVVLAAGNPIEGYVPPSSLDGESVYYIEGATEDEVSMIREQIINAIKKNIKGSNVKVSLPSDVVRYNPVFLVSDNIQVAKKMKIVHTRMPALLVTKATTWCRDVKFQHNIVQNQFKQNRASYIKMNSKMGTGLTVFETTAVDNGYRGKAYSEVFSKLQEKDLVNMLLQLESVGKEGFNDSYEYMRDLYRLVKVSQQYSVSQNYSADDPHYIHPDTYTYVYVPESIAKYNDLESQKIYWLNILTSTVDDPMTEKELSTIRTRNLPISWQMVEYDKYAECNTTGVTKVYALSPFASPYLRTYYETMSENGLKVDGCFGEQDHSGADWAGRKKINDILESGKSATSTNTIGKKIYDYEYGRLSKVLNADTAKKQLQDVLKEQTIDNPVVAVAPGVVEKVAYSARAGFYVRILHSEYNGAYSYYVHLKRWPEVSVGDYVGAGTIIGYEGNTGRSFGSHLHFQLKVGGEIKSPQDYIFPTFNPFYYEEKAAESNYSLQSDYMSLERTVRMVSSMDPKIENRVPTTELVDDYAFLIMDQGKIARPEKYSGTMNWSANYTGDTVEGYVKYLDEKKYHDLYLEAIFFDRERANAEGLLDTDPELFGIIFGNITVKTDMAGALPALTEEELVKIIDTWLPARYSDETKVQWLKENVFTSENIKAIIEYQNKYNVSAVFALAVATQEQQMGLSGTALAMPDTCNIFSIKGEDSQFGYILYQNDQKWRKYGTYGHAFEDFMQLIAERGPYFKDNRYSIGAIAVKYCEGNTWGKAVSNVVLEIMKYYTGENWSMPGGTAKWVGDNSSLMEIIRNCMAFYVDNGYKYCQASGAGRMIPPCDDNWNIIQSKHVCGSCSKNCSSPAYRTDCSTYVSWVIYEYAKANGFTELQNEFSHQHSSYDFKDIGNELNRGNKNGYLQYFEIVRYGIPGNNFKNIESELQPGDILVYREGDGHHVEFVGEEGRKVYSCGTNPTSKEAKSSYSRRSDATCAIRLLSAGNTNSGMTGNGTTSYNGNDGKGINAGNEKEGSGKKYGGTATIGDLSFESEDGLPQLELDITNVQDTTTGIEGTNHPSWQKSIWEDNIQGWQNETVCLQDEICFMAMKYGIDPVLIPIQINKEGNDWAEDNRNEKEAWNSEGPFSIHPKDIPSEFTDVYGNNYTMDLHLQGKSDSQKNIIGGKFLVGYIDKKTSEPRVNVQMEIGCGKFAKYLSQESDVGKGNDRTALRHTAWRLARQEHGANGDGWTPKKSSFRPYLKYAYSGRNIYWIMYKDGKYYKVNSSFDDNRYIDEAGNKIKRWDDYVPQEIDYTLVLKNGDITTKYKYTPDGVFYKWVVGEDFVTKYEYEESPNFSYEYLERDLPFVETIIKLVDDGEETEEEKVSAGNGTEDELYDIDRVPIEDINSDGEYGAGTGSDVSSTTSAGSAGEAFVNLAAKCIKWLAINNFTYYKNNEKVYVPPYNGDTFVESSTPKKNEVGNSAIDCVRYVKWVLYEYGKENGISDLMSGPSSSISDYYKIAKGTSSNGWAQYFDTVYASSSELTKGLGTEHDAQWIKDNLKPGDILVYTGGAKRNVARSGNKGNGEWYSNHIDIFAGFTGEDDGNSIGVKIFSCGSAPGGSYKQGEAKSANYKLSHGSSDAHGFWDVTAVLRLKDDTLKNASSPTSEDLPQELIGTYERHVYDYIDKPIGGQKVTFSMYTPENITTNMPLIIIAMGQGEYGSLEKAKSKAKILGKLMDKKCDLDAIVVVVKTDLDAGSNRGRIDAIRKGLIEGFVDAYGRKLTVDPNKTALSVYSLSSYEVPSVESASDSFRVYILMSIFKDLTSKTKYAKKVFITHGDESNCMTYVNKTYDGLKKAGTNVEIRTNSKSHGSQPGYYYSDANFLNEVLSCM